MHFKTYRFDVPDRARGEHSTILDGWHIPTEMPVRCRILSPSLAGDDEQRMAYRRQARRWARLNHRGVAPLLEMGEVEQGQGPLERGALFFVSAGEGNSQRLGQVLAQLSWPQFSHILAALLEAMAHAHARDVIHGHLHPDLVAYSEAGDGRPAVQIFDFGLIPRDFWHRESPALSDLVDSYQAPEVRRGAISAIGAHSDIYSLGLIAFEWLYGRLPTELGEAPSRREQNHFVPGRLAAWIDRCLSPLPEDRFHLAADALAALETLDLAESSISMASIGCPRMPARWEVGDGPQPSGCHWWWKFRELYSCREPPVVGRRAECDALWQSLYEVRRTGRARAMIISGSPGMGAGRLSRWLGHRAMELGAARTLTISHGVTLRPGDGPMAMLARAFAADLTDPSSLTESLRLGLRCWGAEIGESELDQWLELLGDRSNQNRNQRRNGEFCEPPGALWRTILERLSTSRPLVITIDNAHLGSTTLDWLDELMASPNNLNLLFVLVVAQKELANQPIERVQLEQLLDYPQVDQLELTPLSQNDTVDLIDALAPLEEGLAYEVAQRTAGNPLFVMQLLRYWVDSEVLKPLGPRTNRLKLADFDDADMPRGLLEVTQWEIERFAARFEDQADDALAALEVAAALGMEVTFEEWRQVCDRLGVDVPPLFIRGLFDTGIFSEAYEEQSFSFDFSPAREVLQRRSKETGTHRRIHQVCAEVLADQGDDQHWSWPGRMGVHLAEAGAFEEALEYLIDGAHRQGNHDDPRQSLTLLVRYHQVCDRLELPDDDGRRIRGLLRQAWSHLSLGDRSAAQRTIADVRRRLPREDEEEFLAPILWLESGIAFDVSDLDTAEKKLKQALKLFEAQGDLSGVAKSELRLGSYRRETGQLQEAHQRFVAARDIFQQLEDPTGTLIATQQAATVLIQLKRYDEAELLLRSILNHENALGPSPRGSIYNSLGELYRSRRQWQRAEDAYHRAIYYWQENHQHLMVMAQINLALALVEQGSFFQAEIYLSQAEDFAKAPLKSREIVYIKLISMTCLAARHEWSRWCDLASEVETYVMEKNLRSRDVRLMFKIALSLAEQSAPEAVIQWARALYNTQFDATVPA